MKNIILYEDDTLESCTNIEKILQNRYFDIQYIMISLSDENPIYVIHSPKKFMRTFKKAYVQFTSIVTRFSSIDDEYQHQYPIGESCILPTIDKEIDTISELLKYLHSINRINYCNKLSHANHDESICYEIFDFLQFSIIIDTEDDVEKFSLNMDMHTERGKFGSREILRRLRKIYSPLTKSPKFFLGKKKWSFRYNTTKRCLIGMILEESSSYLLIAEEDNEVMSNILYSAYCYNIIYSTEVSRSDVEQAKVSIDEGDHFSMSEAIRYNSLWVRTVNHFMEYIAYLPFLYTNLLTMIDPCNKHDLKYNIDTKITIALYTHKFVELEVGPDKPINVAKIIEVFYQLSDS